GPGRPRRHAAAGPGDRGHQTGPLVRTVAGPAHHVVVVGAGLAGLSATLHLLGAGRAVTVLETEDGPGGRAASADMGGYRIDTGASVLTMPELVGEGLGAGG